jgi:hypothetical protein
MLVQDAQREVRTVFVGGFWGQLVSSIIWLASAGIATWVSPKAGIWTVVAGGFFIYPLTQLLLRLSGRRASVARDNPLGKLGMQIAFAGGLPMLLLVPVTEFRLTSFYPALMVLTSEQAGNLSPKDLQEPIGRALRKVSQNSNERALGSRKTEVASLG